MKKSINDYFKTHKTTMFIWIIITAAVSFLAPLKAFILQWIIDSSSKKQAVMFLGLGLIVTVASYIFESLSRRLYMSAACKAETFIRNSVMRNTFFRDMITYGKEEDSSYISMLTTDIRTTFDDYFSSVFNIVFWGGILICALFMYLFISPVMLIVVVAVSIPPLLMPKFFNTKLKDSRDRYSEMMSCYTQHIKELLGGFETIRNFRREKEYIKVHEDISLKNEKAEENYHQRMNFTITTTSFMSNMTFIIILIFGMFLVFDGRITMGYMVTASSLANFVISPCQIISQNYAKIKSSKGIRDRIEEKMNSGTEDRITGLRIGEIQNIHCDSVSFKYPETVTEILRGICFDLGNKEKAAIIGKSGSGKSTFAKLLYGYYPEYRGDILINGIELGKINREEYLTKVGYISQSTFLFNDTLRNNICLYEEFTEEELENAIELSGLRNFVEALPEKLDTVIQENGKNLSGGQRQRIAIARLIVRQYMVIIADEITASLDEGTTEQVMNNLLSLDCMVIAITHDTKSEFMKKFDKVYDAADGKFCKY